MKWHRAKQPLSILHTEGRRFEPVIAKTTNGGTTWTGQSAGSTTDLFGADFTDTSTGWVVGSSGTIRKTTDGGTNWTAQTSGTTWAVRSTFFLSGQILKMDFLDESNGWIVGSAGTVRYTSNGDASWASQASGTTKTYLGVHSIDATTGYAVGSGQTIVKYKATVPGPTSPDCSILRDARSRSRATRRAVHSRPAPIFANSVPRSRTRTCID